MKQRILPHLQDYRRSKTDQEPVAVIEIGTSSLRMVIAEIDDDGHVRVCETLTQAVALGKDTFLKGRIAKKTVELCVSVLMGFGEKLAEYKISDHSHIRVVATSAVREAENRQAFVDRIFVATGLQVEVLDEAEVHRMVYLGVHPLLEDDDDFTSSPIVVVEVGGGSTELLVQVGNDVTYSHGFRLGSLRLRETLEAARAPISKQKQLMQSQTRQILKEFQSELNADMSYKIVGLGGDLRFAADQLIGDRESDELGRLPLASLENFANRIVELSPDEISRQYHMTNPEAETIGPALLVLIELAKLLKQSKIFVAEVNLRDGLLNDFARGGIWEGEIQRLIQYSAIRLGRRFHFDESHACHVALLSETLFDQLAGIHQLSNRHRLLLSVSAILHEIGRFVGTSSLHKHSMYLISHSELFGLGRSDLQIVALTARYHRRASPKPSHTQYMNLPQSERIAVAKMAALLRLAIALDTTRSQTITAIDCQKESGRMIINVKDNYDLSSEQIAISQNKELFEEVFGLTVQLRTSVSDLT